MVRRGRFSPILFLLSLFAGSCIDSDRAESDALPLFSQVHEGRISTDGGASRGIAWGDFDDDGDADLVVANTSGQWNALYLNTTFGRRDDWRAVGESGVADAHMTPVDRFIKVSDPNASPLGGVASARGNTEGVAWIDYDGDGDLDLHMVTRGAEPDLLFENTGGEGLVRITHSPLARAAGSSMACWADVDGDGWLDVFLVAYRDNQRNTLFRNTGEGRFQPMPQSPASVGTGTGRACAWGDPNDDGLPDLYVGNASEPNLLFRNRGNFVLEQDTEAGHAVEHVGYTYGLSWADFDEDGFQDLFVANFDVANMLYRNDGEGRLELVLDDPVVDEQGGASKGHAWGDYDLDGDLDLFVANGTYGPDMRNFVYLNLGDGHFVRDEHGEYTTHADTSAGLAWADFDRDGDLDVFVANWGSSDQMNRLYRNNTVETTGRNWLAVRLRADPPNTYAWGAKVRAKATIRDTSRWLSRWNIPTTGYGSQNELMIHFGLDDAEIVDSLIVQWPSGAIDVHTMLPVRAALVITESGTVAVDDRLLPRIDQSQPSPTGR